MRSCSAIKDLPLTVQPFSNQQCGGMSANSNSSILLFMIIHLLLAGVSRVVACEKLNLENKKL
jgi:hypothetical protein